ncbi:MAG TPA: hypothetical protein PLP99_11040 [Ignavibacteriales bacterium]|nr:hypothetical protein [Ignavibacteriales bacterium]HOL82274.1 hypothetical protein [Ignavibacteriales bacterium]HPP34494.1 hypothetical protein [Ignavibacteriales bacterium]HRR19628.1 hypothetical protein [Ignavibacteriales bacterium]HRT98703.1 hypothetical protein [Ignavibacteriales bacterium]
MLKILSLLLFSMITFSQNSTKLTIYNQYALVNENFTISLKDGVNEYFYYNIPSNFNLDFIYLSLDAKILNQSIVIPPFQLNKILENQEVDLIHKDGNLINGKIVKFENSAAVLSDKNNNLMIIPNINDYQIKTNVKYNEKQFKPYIKWEIEAKKGEYPANLTYRVNGISWNADYILIINKNKANIKSFYTINNNTDIEYNNMDVKFVSGEIQNVFNQRRMTRTMSRSSIEKSVSDDDDMVQENLNEYKIYTYNKKVNLPSNSSKQYEYFSAEDINIQKILYFETSQYNELRNEKPFIQYKIKNDKSNKLGYALPTGKFMTYENLNDELIFTGEDIIKDIPIGDDINIKIGKAFDVLISQNIMSNNAISDKISDIETAIKIKNTASEEKYLEIVNNLYSNYEILKTTDEYEKLSSNKIKFSFKMKPNSEKTIILKVRFKNF